LLASVKEHLRLFAQQGIRLFSAKGKVQLQAQDNDIELIAKRVIEIMSTGDWIKATAAKGIRLQSGPTEVTITPEGVKWVTPGYDHVYAADHQTFTPSSAAAVAMPKLPVIPAQADYSVRLDSSAIQTSELLPQVTTNFANFSVEMDGEKIASMPLSETSSQKFVFADQAGDADIYLKSDDDWQTEINSLDEGQA
jgi:uncharacterized protein (DUF2345 family)